MNADVEQLKQIIFRLTKENEDLKQLLNQHGIEYVNHQNEIQKCHARSSLSPQDKIATYRSLFRGREDVYATRWENTRTNRSGYAPACQNEWHKKLCRKPKIKCSICPNQNWKPLTDQILYSHLKGDCFIGIYSLLQDDQCYFVAIDFDKEHWQKDVLAFSKICNEYGVPHLVERSQSGNGAHVWIFFKEAILATTARNLATALLILTMQLHPSLSMDSYDRLFPNQDTLPKGGFGHLIALPLQGKRRTQSNSTFIQVDDDFLPYADPWQVLQEIKRLNPLEVERLLEKIQKITGILDVSTVSSEDEDSLP